MRLRPLVGLFLVAVLLSACSGTPPAPKLARVEIAGGGFLLAGAGASRSLAATVFDNFGAVMPDEEVAWESSDGAVITVNSAGVVSAVGGSGSAQVVARSGGVKSSPVLVTVGGLAPGAVLLDDDEFTSEPVPVDPSLGFRVGALFTVGVQDAGALSLGDIVVSSGARQVVGRVSQVNGDILTLEVAPLGDVFPDLVLPDQTLSHSVANVKVDGAAAEYFTSSRAPDGALRLQLKTQHETAAPESVVVSQQTGSSKLGPFECVAVTGSVFPLSLSVGSFEYREKLSIENAWSDTAKKLIVHLEPNLDVDLRVRATSSVPADSVMRCSATLFESLTPFAGALGFYLGASVPSGISFTIGGKLEVANTGLEILGTINPKLSAGFACTGGDCQAVSEFDDGGSFSLKPLTPTIPEGQNVRHELGVYAFTSIEPGILREENGVLHRSMTSRLLSAEAGRTLSTNFATLETQALTPNEQGRSWYLSYFKSSVRAGSGDTAVLNLIGVPEFSLSVTPVAPRQLGESPDTTISLGAIVGFDKGNPIPLSITTTSESLKFHGNDNVARYRAYVLTDDDELIEIANIIPPLGQTKTDFTWIATHDSDDLQRILVFVTSAFLPDQPIAGKTASIVQDRLELVGTFELALNRTTTESEREEYPRYEPPVNFEWIRTFDRVVNQSYQARVHVNAFYENGDWNFIPQSWDATRLLSRTTRDTMVYDVRDWEYPSCVERVNWYESSFDGASVDSAVGSIEAVAAGTQLQFFARSEQTIHGTSSIEWDWPCFRQRRGLDAATGNFSGPNSTDSFDFSSSPLEIFINPLDPSTWTGTITSGTRTVSWSFTEVPEF